MDKNGAQDDPPATLRGETTHLERLMGAGGTAARLVRVAALIGDPAARGLVAGSCPDFRTDKVEEDSPALSQWLMEICRSHQIAGVRAAVAAARLALPIWSAARPWALEPLRAIERAQAWVDSQSAENTEQACVAAMAAEEVATDVDLDQPMTSAGSRLSSAGLSAAYCAIAAAGEECLRTWPPAELAGGVTGVVAAAGYSAAHAVGSPVDVGHAVCQELAAWLFAANGPLAPPA